MNPWPSPNPLSRRDFLAAGTLAAGALGAAALSPAIAVEANLKAAPRFPIIAFSKPFQTYSPEQTASLVARIGWDGLEIPVRPKGHIEPEHAPDELPKFAEALRHEGRDIHLVTTGITSLKTPHAETVLRTMAKLGIRKLRLGFYNYPPNQAPAERLKEVAPMLKDIAAACGELGLQAGFQNHSGRQYVGAPVWDVYSMIRDLDPKQIGFCFDIGHATLEGGLSWPTTARLAEPFFTAVFVKDFLWKKEAAGWKDSWCPLGDGMVSKSFFSWLQKTNYRGPISQHHEYALGVGANLQAHLEHDFKVLKSWLA